MGRAGRVTPQRRGRGRAVRLGVGVGLGVALTAGAPVLGAPAAQAAEPVVSPVGGAWTVHGHGYGHGHGLSQWGAQSRALAGQSAQQILEFYYPGTGEATAAPRGLRVGLTTWAGPVVRVRSAGSDVITLTTSGHVLSPDQTLVLTRSGSALVATALGADGAAAWTETWTSAPVISGAGRFALVRADGSGTVYEGSLRIPTGTGPLLPVNTLDLEAYLRGVVPNESPPSWRPAALQAQAVAARGYVLSTLAPGVDHDTCDTTACQVYKGWATRSTTGVLTSLQPASSNDAVAATAGRYRTDASGAPAFTQFSSNDGGWTAAGGRPYLVAAEDPYSTRTGSTSGDTTGTWTASLSVATVSRSCPSGGTATALQPTGRDGNGEWGGRLTSLRLTCTTGSVTLTGAGATRFDLRSNWWMPVPTLSGTAVTDAWQATGGTTGPLGAPTGAETPTPDGRGSYQHFAGGSVYWTPSTGAHVLTGDVREKWASLGWERSSLGYPTSDTLPTPDGRGRYAHFQNGSVYWSAATGAHVVRGAIRAEWADLGWEGSALGYPTTDETATPDGKGRYNHFQHGSVYWTATTGAHALTGDVRARWVSLGWEKSALGYPTTDARTTPDGRGTYQHFTGGSVYSTATTGTHALTRAVRDAWASIGWEGSRLGYPTTDTTPTPDGRGVYAQFQGGAVYWTAATGAHPVYGVTGDVWASMGWERSYLGYPTSGVGTTPDGLGTYQHFQGGSVYRTAATGAHAISRPVRDRWASLGWERSRLGYPTGSTTATATGSRTAFEHGSITWDSRTGATAVEYS